MYVECSGYIDVFIFYTHVVRNAVYVAVKIQVVWDVTLCYTLDEIADSNHRQHRLENYTYHLIHVCEYFGMGTWEIQISRDRTPCRMFNSWLCFGGACCFHFEGIPLVGRWKRNLPLETSVARVLTIVNMEAASSPEVSVFNNPQGVTSNKTGSSLFLLWEP